MFVYLANALEIRFLFIHLSIKKKRDMCFCKKIEKVPEVNIYTGINKIYTSTVFNKKSIPIKVVIKHNKKEST